MEVEKNIEINNMEPPITQPENVSGVTKRKISIPLLVLGISLVIILVLSFAIYFLIGKKSQGKTEGEASYVASGANKSGDLATTEKSLEEALKNDPNDPKLLAAIITSIANEGNLLGREGEAFEKGKPYADNALKVAPQNEDVLIAVGFLYEIGGDYQAALSYYEKALVINPKNANGLFHKGHVLEFLNRSVESMNAYIAAYEIDKENPLVLMALGKMALNQGKIDDAVTFYKTASAVPDVTAYEKAEALTNAAIIRRSQMLYMDEAIGLAQQAVDAYPSYSPALATLGFAQGINGKMVEGVENMKKAIAANPRISQNYWYLGMLLRSVKVYDEALKYQKEGFIKLDQDNTLVGNVLRAQVKAAMAYDLAKTTYLSGSTAGVIEYLKTALEFDPTLKTQLKDDIAKYNQFVSIANTAEMQALIK